MHTNPKPSAHPREAPAVEPRHRRHWSRDARRDRPGHHRMRGQPRPQLPIVPERPRPRASCSELYDQRARFDDEDTLAKIDSDLARIGCTSPNANRND